ncbi:MAG: type-F conjugative transfer system secretin TraK [Candidatus Nitrospinota bacterium M3_3B_026]
MPEKEPNPSVARIPTRTLPPPSTQQANDEPVNEVTEVLPEIATHVRLSSTDVNRVVCPSEIHDVVFSKEKGVDVKVNGRNAFVKFLVKKEPDGKEVYSKTPTELFVVCGGDVYTLITQPACIPSRTIRLSSGSEKRIEENLELMGSLPFEKKVLDLIKSMYTDDIPDSFLVKSVDEPVFTANSLDVRLKRIIEVEGEGLRGKEFLITLEGKDAAKLSEKDFLHPAITKKPLGITLDKLRLGSHGDTARLLIVERSMEE